MQSHGQRVHMLDDLEHDLPAMVAAHPDAGDFWAAFKGQADVIEDGAGAHSAAMGARIGAMLAHVEFSES